MRPVTHTPHNLNTTGSMGTRSIFWIRFPSHAVVNVETLFESPAHILPSFTVRVT